MKRLSAIGLLLSTVLVSGQGNYEGRWTAATSDNGRVFVDVDKNAIVDVLYSAAVTCPGRGVAGFVTFKGAAATITANSFKFSGSAATQCGEASIAVTGTFKSTTTMDGSGTFTPPKGGDQKEPTTFTWSAAEKQSR